MRNQRLAGFSLAVSMVACTAWALALGYGCASLLLLVGAVFGAYLVITKKQILEF